jgi:hypothetical protein
MSEKIHVETTYRVCTSDGWLDYDTMKLVPDEDKATTFTDWEEAKDGFVRCKEFKIGAHPRIIRYEDGEMEYCTSVVPRKPSDWAYCGPLQDGDDEDEYDPDSDD